MEDRKELGGGPGELRQDALVEKLVVDPTKPADVQVLVGFLGRSSEAENWRLYLTPQLDSYVEFRAGDVVHTQPLTDAHSPLGGTMIWLKGDATLKHARTGTRQAQAEFVQGDIMSSFIAEPSIQEMLLRRGRVPVSVARGCHPYSWHNCRQDSFFGWQCPSVWPFSNC